MKKEKIKLFESDELTLKERFLIFMNLLVNNQSESRIESMIFFIIFYLQTISGFFSPQVNIFDSKKSTSDNILMNLGKIIRFKEVVMNDKDNFEFFIYIWAIYLFLISCYIIIILFKTNRESLYSISYYIGNLIIKITYYMLYNIILDFFSSLLCFGDEKNTLIKDYSCPIKDHITIFIISLSSTFYCIYFVIFLQNFYIDAFYLSINHYAQLTSYYNLILCVNSIIFSIMKSLIHKFSTEVFLIVNFIISIYLFYFYFQKIIFYDNITNTICGIFHIVYIWTSLFCFIVKYLTITEKGIIWLLTSLLVIFIFFNIRNKFENWIFCEIPYYKIENINHLLYYLRSIITMINTGLDIQSTKTRLTGIIQLHILECPNPKCLTKTKQKLYLPTKNEWSDRSKPFINDNVFLNNLIVAIMTYFINTNFYSPELLINFSFYYLDVIGNLCLSIYFFHKVKLMKMTQQEIFTLERLKIKISEKLIEKLKKENEVCYRLEDLNMTFIFKYEYFKKKFYNEIMIDLDLTEKFWKFFSKKENKSIIDFNKVFKISEKIMISKLNVELLWKKLFSLYTGINEVFNFYCDYIEEINDDSFLKRELESIKRKNETSSDSINQNFYNLMFKNETGIIILNGDNGKEGIIEKVNSEFEKIFKYNYNELKDKNISILMPKIFANQHQEFMQNFINIGERTIICTKEYSTFGKDKNNSIIFIKLYIKIFPILNNSVYFIGMFISEKLDDLIFIDSNFIIQGMSKKIQDTLKLKNKLFFNENDIPFYMICKNFINFYKIFMKGNKKEIIDENNISEESEDFSQTYIYEEEIKIEEEQNENNIEINENIELEYEIKIPNFMMEFQKNTKKGLILENVAPETIIVEKSNLIDNTRISTNFLMNEEQESLISKEEKSHHSDKEDNHLGFNLNRMNSKIINNNDNKEIHNSNLINNNNEIKLNISHIDDHIDDNNNNNHNNSIDNNNNSKDNNNNNDIQIIKNENNHNNFNNNNINYNNNNINNNTNNNNNNKENNSNNLKFVNANTPTPTPNETPNTNYLNIYSKSALKKKKVQVVMVYLM